MPGNLKLGSALVQFRFAETLTPTPNFGVRSHDTAQNDNRPYHFCAKNEYIDGQFLVDGCASRQRQVDNGADVVFTYTQDATDHRSTSAGHYF